MYFGNDLRKFVVCTAASVLALPSLVSAELRSLTDFHYVTRGAWLGDAIHPYQFFNETSSLDLDGDLQPDVTLTHGYRSEEHTSELQSRSVSS